MYCSYCGKEIPEDSNYCKYCGKEIAHPSSGHIGSTISMIEKFKSLSIKKQILIICYILWFLLWFCFVLANSDEHYFVTEILFYGVLYGVILPIAVCCIWYIISMFRKRKHENTLIQATSSNQRSASSDSELSKAETEPTIMAPDSVETPIKEAINLVDFAKEMGQMKIIKKDVGLPTEKVYYAFVKDGIITAEVEIATGMPNLSAEEISKQKDCLYIKQNSLGKYELVFLTKS
jgi:uncharacterized membrane protein (DUF485 family)